LGYAYYKQNDFENAISNKIINGKDFVAKYYHLGESYLKLDKKQEALNAFKNASEMPFDSSIQEDASLNYAKLSYEMGIRTKAYLRFCWALSKKYPNNASPFSSRKIID
jgi:TolA-binding protein